MEMKPTILVAGGTGNLGGKIVKSLIGRGANVRVLARHSTDAAKIDVLEREGVKVFKVDLRDAGAVEAACAGANCVVSALQGLREVIGGAQTILLEAAVAAGVARFIPSDFSLDFTLLAAGGNRNFDLRREFGETLDAADIKATSVFNGAFAEILTYGTPLLDKKNKTVGYWGDDADWRLQFTTMDDTAEFTAVAAMDETAPRYLRIAGFQISPSEMAKIAGENSNSEFSVVRMGSLAELAAYADGQRKADPESEKELYPRWQNSQYIHDMFSVKTDALDNDRYDNLHWTGAADFLRRIL